MPNIDIHIYWLGVSAGSRHNDQTPDGWKLAPPLRHNRVYLPGTS